MKRIVSRIVLLLLGLAAVLPARAANSIWISDPAGELGDTSGDIRAVGASVRGDFLFLTLAVQGLAAPAVEQTAEGMINRYYYHWLLDTDNNPATGRSNAEYEGSPTGVTKPVGAERVVQIGWRNGKPDGVYAYDALDDENTIVPVFTFQASGDALTAIIPISELGLTRGQTIGVSAFQEGQSEGWKVDWVESAALTLEGPALGGAVVADPVDMGDTSGDIRSVGGQLVGDHLLLWLTVEGMAAPSVLNTPEGMINRYYYHWLVDTDNNPATGRSNSEYEGTPTGLTKPVGSERVIQIGWRDNKPDGVYIYDALNDETTYLEEFSYQASGNTLSALVPLSALGLTRGQTIGLSAFQEGQSEGWKVDWVESASLTLDGPEIPVAAVADPVDMGDSSGDIRTLAAFVDGEDLHLRLSVQGLAAPDVDQTAEGMINRYYYHWLLDTDNNPATGRSNAEYEGTPTGLTKPVGAERVIQIGWRDGKPDGVYVYDALNDENTILPEFTYQASGNTLSAVIPLSALGLSLGQTIGVTAFQEGQSEGWKVDWIESASLTLQSSQDTNALPSISLETLFSADAYGFEIELQDSVGAQADTNTISLALDGTAINNASISKAGGVTKIVGRHPALLEAGTTHEISLSLNVGTELQGRDFVFQVEPYTVLSAASRAPSVASTNRGFLTYFTQITLDQTFQTSLHSNIAEQAEVQLAGGFTPEGSVEPYYNEANLEDTPLWKGAGHVVEGVINWFELAPGVDTSINFPGDEPIPVIFRLPADGLVAEILTYLELSQGSHKLGLYTEGGHKVTAGLTGSGPVLSLSDNSAYYANPVGDPPIPTYFGRNQFFNVVAPEAGYYPIRVLWFQDKRRQEPGVLLEFFSVEDRALHLVNDSSDPLSIKAFRAGPLLTPGVEVPEQPVLAVSRNGANVALSWQGSGFKLQSSPSLPANTWTDVNTTGNSHTATATGGGNLYFRLIKP